MLAHRRLLKALIAFTAGAPLESTLRPGLYRDSDGRPVLRAYGPEAPVEEEEIRSLATELLRLASVDLDLLEGHLNRNGIVTELVSPIRVQRRPLTRPQGELGWLIPTVRQPQDWPSAILALLLTDAPAGDGDCLANRIAQCSGCQNFFLLPTSRRSRYCSKTCRNRQ